MPKSPSRSRKFTSRLGYFNNKYVYIPTRADGHIIVVLARVAGTSATRERSVVWVDEQEVHVVDDPEHVVQV